MQNLLGGMRTQSYVIYKNKSKENVVLDVLDFPH